MSTIISHLSLSAHWLNIIIGSALLVFGFIGNVLTIIIFTRPTFRNASSVSYLVASSAANFIPLGLALVPRILHDGFGVATVRSSSSYCQARTYLSTVMTLCSISYPCWASFDHFVSTSRNAATRQYWTSKRFVRCAIFGTLLFWLLLHIPTGIFSKAEGQSCIGKNVIHVYIRQYILTPLTNGVLPVLTISYFNAGIVRNLRQTKSLGSTQINGRLVRQVRRMLVPQLLILVISGIPFSIQIVYEEATHGVYKDPLLNAVEKVIQTIIRLLFYLNHVCSFYVYYMMSSEVRREVKGLLTKRNAIVPQMTIVRSLEIIQK